MELRRIEMTGFGCLREEQLEFEPGRANLILARNEAGKSTLLGAIEVALYGWPSARLAEGRELRRKFRPWAGGPSRIRLDLRADGHDYRIEHELLDGAGNEVEQAAIFRDEQDVTDEMRAAAEMPGPWLLGLSRDDFRRSVLVRQGELDLVAQDTEQLVKYLESVVTSAEAGASATVAQQRLAEALDDYRARAGLEHWASTHLSRAKEWSRVEGRLVKEIEDRRTKRAELERRRSELEAEITALDASDARLDALRRARDCLRVLERAVHCRNLRRQIDEDESLRRQIAALGEKIASLDDVRDFPAERAEEFVRLIEREAQSRRQWKDAEAAVERACEDLRASEAQREALAAVAPLVDRVDTLVTQQALFERAVAEKAAAERRVVEERQTLVDAGLPLEQLAESRLRYNALDFEERQTVCNLEKRDFEFDSALREHERQIEKTQAELAAIRAERSGRRRQGMYVAAAAAAIATAACLLLALIAGSPGLAVVAGVLGAAGVAWGVYRTVAAGMLAADRRAELRVEVESLQRAQQECAENRQRLHDHVAELAGRQGLSAETLLASVREFLEHRDALLAHDLAQRDAETAGEEVARQQEQWAGWLAEGGRMQSNDRSQSSPTGERHDGLQTGPDRLQTGPTSGDPESHRADVDAIEPPHAVALVSDVQRCATLNRSAARMGDALHDAERTRTDRGRVLLETHESIRQLLAAAGVPLPEAQTGEPIAPEEIVVARREFQSRLKRYSERQSAVAERDSLRRRQIGDEDRDALRLRAERAAAELTEIEATAGAVAESLAWLHSQDRPAACESCAAWTIEALTDEALTHVQERVSAAIEESQQTHARTWQDTRAFLNDHARQRRTLDDELAELEAELARGRRFAAAVTKARTTLASVQSSTYERWSELMRARLVPLLDVLLPDYRLESVAADLSPVLVHRPTRQRLTMDAVQLHLSRGAKDRLFLALRLALAEVLGEERGVRLPLLLDDPLANWDDESLADGLELLSRLGDRGGTLAVFTCQRSRCESAIAGLNSARTPAICELLGADAGAQEDVRPS